MSPRQILFALIPPLCFGTGFTIAKPVVQHFPPLFMMLMVYGGIALVLAVTARQPLKTPWLHIVLISAFAVTIQGALLFWGLKGLTATTANLVLQTQVPMAVLLGWLINGEDLNIRKSLGTALALLGVAMVIGLPQDTPPLLPVMLTVAGAFAWALGQVLAQKFGKEEGIGLLKANAYGSLPQLLVATVLFEHGQFAALQSATAMQWAMLAFLGGVGFYLAYACWFGLLRQCRMDEVAPFILLMPVVGIVTASVWLGETISLEQIAGGAVILAGLAIVSGLDRIAREKAGQLARS